MIFLKKIDSLLEKIIELLLYAFLALLVFLSFLQIILRNFFDTSIIWGDVLLRHSVLLIAFLGAAIATKFKRHISLEIGKRYLNIKLQKIISLLIDLFSAIVCYLLSIASFDFVFDIIGKDEILFLGIPTQIFILFIPIGYLIISLRFIFNFIFTLNEIKKGNWEIVEENS